MLTTIVAFLVALGLLITFHELGHYWAARRCGVKVLRFSVGFGKPVWIRRDRNGTQWAISAIPLGGYVKMQDEADKDSLPGEAFNEQPVWNRFFIVAAGPLANFILAILVYTALNLMGSEEPMPYLAQPPSGTLAAQAGIQAQDLILSVNGEPVKSWPQARWLLVDQSMHGGVATLELESGGRHFVREIHFPGVTGDTEVEKSDPLAEAGLALATSGVRIGGVQPGSAGEAAGLAAGDIVLSVDSHPVSDVRQFINYVSERPDQNLTIVVQRDNVTRTVLAHPARVELEDGRIVGRLGVAVSAVIPMVHVEYGVLESFWKSIVRTLDTAWFSLKMLGKMVVGDVSFKNLSGPVTIADYAGQSARMGFETYLGFIALVSISIGVLNLLPIPMLDGGHLAFYMYEIVTGSPAPERWLAIGQRAGAALLACLMCLAIFNDFVRLLG